MFGVSHSSELEAKVKEKALGWGGRVSSQENYYQLTHRLRLSRPWCLAPKAGAPVC
jgi:hypothetical protein